MYIVGKKAIAHCYERKSRQLQPRKKIGRMAMYYSRISRTMKKGIFLLVPRIKSLHPTNGWQDTRNLSKKTTLVDRNAKH